MENPVAEVADVVKGLVQAEDAAEQRAYMQKYFAPDASFDHPLVQVAPGANSRDAGILPIYQWLRCMFSSKIDVHSAAFDEKNNKLYVDATQFLIPSIPFIRPFWTRAARLVVVLTLQRGQDGKFYVKRQEDLYQLQVLPFGFIPGAGPAFSLVKRIAGLNCAILAGTVRLTIGYWNPNKPTKAE
ncbi:unnamed protein product [Tilletia controversa]|uniref:SigF-like NTF2-like domain-containing protein n=3 Tax=Tilletia TaxID=13289 RepID=A0A8X7T135_9BASI|nr:hypothetical protein CF335_g7472 [Tilletia laevis]KAE8204422.1 hypothetical protein CF328_g1099 [Tilletia controversa]KAE8246858.1 hypothetical protein A4X03_0g7200 [Tilletia caries]KAE8196792.1 hypothetical protein CF336_g2462 [Tilletia laevis]KAE8256067.1 hypothetical protein A4X06_0g110 [Tilletia controversa]